MLFFNRGLSQEDIMQRLSEEMSQAEYAALSSKILSLADAEDSIGKGQNLNLVA